MEFMSNVSSGIDELKPSLFELISESQLRDLLEPSIRYVLAAFTQRHPRYLIHIFNRYDEVYALFMLLVERHYLKRWGGSFTENFYGLKRERAIARELPRTGRSVPELLAETTRMKNADVWKSLFVTIGIPYLKRKLDDAYEIHAGGAAENLFGANYRRDQQPAENATKREKILFHLKKLFRKIYPSVNALYHFSILAFNLAYLFDKSNYHTPFHFLINLRMRRLSEADHRAFEAASRPTPRPTPNPTLTARTLRSPTAILRLILPRLLDSLKVLLPTSIFFLKFLEWWHASDFARQLSAKTTASIELPPPAVIPPPIQGTEKTLERDGKKLVKVPEDSRLCGICENELTNPTAVQTGYVFCYPCIFRWVKGDNEDGEVDTAKGCCPVTGVRLLGGVEGLRRIMV
ncbi:ubiquitin-protein ligase peroxin 12 [Rhizina undulata]